MYHRDQWNVGDEAWYEYHCFESDDSQDAELWYRSHQKVEVLDEGWADGADSDTFLGRLKDATPKVYSVKFADGYIGDAFEDELYTNSAGWERPDPPPRPTN